MSKIYEALRRAEQDRNTEEDDTPATPRTKPGPSFAARPRKYVPMMEPRERAPAASAAGRMTTWRPLLAQLPALQASGGAVEQFRTLRSRMQEFRDLNTLKTVMISSGRMEEGKSFVAVNLAIAFARHKASRVLLIDGDMRRSSLHKRLGCSHEPGLTEYLSGHASMQEVMQRAKLSPDDPPIVQGLASLTFIPGGGDAGNAADLSGNSRFGELISAASPLFDWIVVDSAPVNMVSDGVNLARACDGVLLVARGGVTSFESAQRALAELKSARTLGVVLNAVQNPPNQGGHYGYYGYDENGKKEA